MAATKLGAADLSGCWSSKCCGCVPGCAYACFPCGDDCMCMCAAVGAQTANKQRRLACATHAFGPMTVGQPHLSGPELRCVPVMAWSFEQRTSRLARISLDTPSASTPGCSQWPHIPSTEPTPKKLLKGTHQSSATHAFEPHIGTASMTTPSSRGARMEAHSVSSRWSTRRRCTPTRAAARLKPKRGRAWSGHAPRPRARLTMQLWRVRRRAMAHASHSRCVGKK